MTDVEWQPISRLRTHEQVLAAIEEQLSNGTLRAGERLPPERQLAEALGVSRGAVREALRILEAIGVVEAGTGSGPTAGSMIVSDSAGGLAFLLKMHLQAASFQQDDLVEVRVVLERLAARKAATEPNEESLARLRGLVEQMRNVTSTAEYNDLDMAFHVELGTMSGNDMVPVLMTALRVALREAMVTAFGTLHDPAATMETLTAEHAGIIDAVAASKPDDAVELITQHITGFYDLAFPEPT